MTAPREQEMDPRPEEQAPQEGQESEPTTSADDQDAEAELAAEEPAEPTIEETLRIERDAFEEKWLRVVAELDNVRKRSRREVVDTRRFAQADILRSLLEFQDNFERALQSTGDSADTEAGDSFRAGVELIYQKFLGVLKEKGVEPMEAVGAEFDPNFHEAVGQVPREDIEPGHVVEVIQQGFHYGDLVLRPARVIISS